MKKKPGEPKEVERREGLGETLVTYGRSNEDAILEKKSSDDSSVFSGLDKPLNMIYNANIPMQTEPPPPPPKEIRKPMHVLIASKHTALSCDSKGSTESTLTSRSERSRMRIMQPMADSEGTLENSTISTVSSKRPNEGISCAKSSDSEAKLMKKINDVADLLNDSDNNTQMTWTSATHKALQQKGTMKLLPTMTFVGEDVGQKERSMVYDRFIYECKSSESSGIVELKTKFEEHVDTMLNSISDDNDENDVLADFNKTLSPKNTLMDQMESIAPEPDHVLTPQEAKKLQTLLYQQKKQVAALSENIELYKYEIEQMEEEYEYELKLAEERTNQKYDELKQMYESEIDSLLQEKEEAVTEACRIASENADEKLRMLQSQIESLQANATSTVGVTENRIIADGCGDADKRIASLHKSHEAELEQMRKVYEEQLESNKDNANAKINAMASEIETLRKEQRSTIALLDFVQVQVEKHYPKEVNFFKMASETDLKSSANFLLPPDIVLEDKSLKKVFAMISFLIQSMESKSTYESSEIEQRELETLNNLVERQRGEIINLKKYKTESKIAAKKLEEQIMITSRKNALLEEKYQTEVESHRENLQRLTNENTTVVKIERSRKDLKHAMDVGKRELEQNQVVKEGAKVGKIYSAERMEIETRKPTIKLEGENIDFCHRYAMTIPTPKARQPIASQRFFSPTNETKNITQIDDDVVINGSISTSSPIDQSFPTESLSTQRAKSFHSNYGIQTTKNSPLQRPTHVTTKENDESYLVSIRKIRALNEDPFARKSRSAFSPVLKREITPSRNEEHVLHTEEEAKKNLETVADQMERTPKIAAKKGSLAKELYDRKDSLMTNDQEALKEIGNSQSLKAEQTIDVEATEGVSKATANASRREKLAILRSQKPKNESPQKGEKEADRRENPSSEILRRARRFNGRSFERNDYDKDPTELDNQGERSVPVQGREQYREKSVQNTKESSEEPVREIRDKSRHTRRSSLYRYAGSKPSLKNERQISQVESLDELQIPSPPISHEPSNNRRNEAVAAHIQNLTDDPLKENCTGRNLKDTNPKELSDRSAILTQKKREDHIQAVCRLQETRSSKKDVDDQTELQPRLFE